MSATYSFTGNINAIVIIDIGLSKLSLKKLWIKSYGFSCILKTAREWR